MDKSLLTISKAERGRVLLHMPLGILTCLFWHELGWAPAIIFGIGFLWYEKQQDKVIKDQGWKDIKGWLWGLGITGSLLIVLKLIAVA